MFPFIFHKPFSFLCKLYHEYYNDSFDILKTTGFIRRHELEALHCHQIYYIRLLHMRPTADVSWGCRSRRIVSHSGDRRRVSLLCELFGVSWGCLPLWKASHRCHTWRASRLYALAGGPQRWTTQGTPFHSIYKHSFSVYLSPCALVAAARQEKPQAELG